MNLYSNKQRWKLVLLGVAMMVVGLTLWYSSFITRKIRTEEHQKVALWSAAIQRKATLVKFTQKLFEDLKEEERKRTELLVKAYKIISDPNDGSDLTFVVDYLWSNAHIPVVIFDANDDFILSVNIPKDKEADPSYLDSLKTAMAAKNPPIALPDVNQFVYYDDSRLFSELQGVMDDLINSFISETVINSASVPVIMVDSLREKVLRFGNIDPKIAADSTLLNKKLVQMLEENEPIVLDLPGQGFNYIYYEDSLVLNLLEFYPLVQLILVGVFLLVAYLIFSTFRKAEQNQVWVGMAKETAHQLGTPLSSLMAWMTILESQGVPPSTLVEMNKDVSHLRMITERFSKIGSLPDLALENVSEVVASSLEYLQTRVSKKVSISMHTENDQLKAQMSRALFGWVLENIVKNAVDAVEGEGKIEARVFREGSNVVIDISDNGKGIHRSKQQTVFQPGFTTKKRGWGLGLSLTKRIVENYHGGKIFVKHSEMGVGTTFRIQLKEAT